MQRDRIKEKILKVSALVWSQGGEQNPSVHETWIWDFFLEFGEEAWWEQNIRAQCSVRLTVNIEVSTRQRRLLESYVRILVMS
jgi:hypothetical protein